MNIFFASIYFVIKRSIYAIIAVLIFCGTMQLSFVFLPKWIDFILGLPLAIYLMISFLLDIKKIN